MNLFWGEEASLAMCRLTKTHDGQVSGVVAQAHGACLVDGCPARHRN